MRRNCLKHKKKHTEKVNQPESSTTNGNLYYVDLNGGIKKNRIESNVAYDVHRFSPRFCTRVRVYVCTNVRIAERTYVVVYTYM